jgi:hypothetical protein
MFFFAHKTILLSLRVRVGCGFEMVDLQSRTLTPALTHPRTCQKAKRINCTSLRGWGFNFHRTLSGFKLKTIYYLFSINSLLFTHVQLNVCRSINLNIYASLLIKFQICLCYRDCKVKNYYKSSLNSIFSFDL